MTLTWKAILKAGNGGRKKKAAAPAQQDSEKPSRQNSKKGSHKRQPQITILNEKGKPFKPKKNKEKRKSDFRSSSAFKFLGAKPGESPNRSATVSVEPVAEAEITKAEPVVPAIGEKIANGLTPAPPRPVPVANGAAALFIEAAPVEGNASAATNGQNQNNASPEPAAAAEAVPEESEPAPALEEKPSEAASEELSPAPILPAERKTIICVVDDEGDLLLECIPDDYDPIEDAELEIRAFQVCSHILRRCSPVFRRMFSPSSAFAESTVHADGLRHASVTCHAESMEIMLNIVHYRRDKIPKDGELSAEQLRELAIFSDQYDVPDASVSYVDSWTQRFMNIYAHSPPGGRKIDELTDLLLVSFVFKLPKLFEVVTKDLATRMVWKGGKMYIGPNCDAGWASAWDNSQEMEEAELSDLLPPSLQGAIEEVNKKAVKELMTMCYDLMKEYLKEEEAMKNEPYYRSGYNMAISGEAKNACKEHFLVDAAFHFVVTKLIKRNKLDPQRIVELKDGQSVTGGAAQGLGAANPPAAGAAAGNAIQNVGNPQGAQPGGENKEEKKDMELEVSIEFFNKESSQINSLFHSAAVKKDKSSGGRGHIAYQWYMKVASIVGAVKGLQLENFVRD